MPVAKPIVTDPADPGDGELVHQSLAGDTSAFERLVNRHFRMVYAIAYVWVKHHESAEDVAQEAFLRAFIHLDRLSTPDRFAGWISRITRNLACDWHRRGRCLVEVISAGSAQESIDNTADARCKEGLWMMEANEQHQTIRDLVGQLPPEQGEVILLHYGDGLSAPEIARLLDIHPGTVRRQIKRAKTTIKTALLTGLRDSLHAFQPPQSAVTRTIAAVGIAAGLSLQAKVLAIHASGGPAFLPTPADFGVSSGGAGSGAVNALNSIASIATAGSKTAVIAKLLGVSLAAGVLLVGTSHFAARNPVRRVHTPQAQSLPLTAVEKTQLAAAPKPAPVPVRPPEPIESIEATPTEAQSLILADAQPPAQPSTQELKSAAAAVEMPREASGTVLTDTDLPPAPARLDRARTLQFPSNRSIGTLNIRDQDQADDPGAWREFFPATGLVTVPAGFEVQLMVSPRAISDLAPLAELKPGDIQWLEMPAGEIPHDQWGQVAKMRGLETLDASDTGITDADLAEVARLASLRRLELKLCKSITDAGIKYLISLSSLEHLELHMSPGITDTGLQYIGQMRNLKTLGLGYTHVTGDGLRHLTSLKSLWALGLTGTDVTDESLAVLKGFPLLRHLSLWGTKIGDKGLAHLAGLSRLYRLDLSGTKVTKAGMVHLANLTSMKELRLDGTQVGDSEPKALTDGDLAEIAKSENLSELVIGYPPKITEAGFLQLKKLKGLKSLVLPPELNVSGDAYAILHEFPVLEQLCIQSPAVSPRDADGVSWLKHLKGLTSLEYLDILGDEITDDDMDHLRGLPALKRLELHCSQVGDPGLARLKDLPSLRWVDAQGTRATEASADILPGANICLSSNGEYKVISASNVIKADESAWQRYVRQFIEMYRLDNGQQNAAHSILRELCDEASRYRRSHQGDFAEVDQLFEQATKLASKPPATTQEARFQKFADLKQRREELERPIQVDLFNKLKQRLETIPTQSQRQQVN